MTASYRHNERESGEMRLVITGQLFSEETIKRLVKESLVPILADAIAHHRETQVVGETKPADSNQLLTISEAASRLGVSPALIRNWIRRRSIEIVRVGRCVRIRPAAVEEIVVRNIVPASTCPVSPLCATDRGGSSVGAAARDLT